MRAEQQIYQALLADAGVTALVDDRIAPDIAEQGWLPPLVVYERTTTEVTATIHQGAPVASKVTISASAWATTPLAAQQIADAMEVALRDVGICVDRFSSFDDTTAMHAAVVSFEVWEL